MRALGYALQNRLAARWVPRRAVGQYAFAMREISMRYGGAFIAPPGSRAVAAAE